MPAQNQYEVRRTKTGLRLFAIKPIPKARRIIEYTGLRITNEKVEQSYEKYFFGVNTKWSIDGSARSNAARYINHSCKPNAEAVISGGRIWIWSRKNIRPGEEITYDYGQDYFDGIIKPLGCKCAKCGIKRTGLRAKRSLRAIRAKRPGEKSTWLSDSSLRGRERALADAPE